MKFLTGKRLRFFSVSAILTAILVFLSFPEYRGQLGLALLLPPLAALLTYLAIGRLQGIEILMLTLLPALISGGAALGQYFYPNFSFPVKLISWVAYFNTFYILLLALNVFKVERLRGETIPLERAAKPAILVLTFLTAFLLLTVIYKLSLGAAVSAFAVFGTVFLLALNDLWLLRLSDLLERRFFLAAAAVGLAAIQISLAFSFFPWEAHLRGLSEAVFFYAVLGVSRAYYERHLKLSIVLEYILVSLAVFLFARFI